MIKNIGVIALVLLVSGCISAPLQRYAKTGDVLTIPFASMKKDTNGEYINHDDLTVTITPNGSTAPLPVKVRMTKRIFDEPASINNLLGMLGTTVASHDGEWVAIVELKDPETDKPLVLAPGPATISIASEKLTPFDNDNTYRLDPAALPIEILEGTASKLPEFVRAHLEVLGFDDASMIVQPSALAGEERFGGMQLQFSYTPAGGAAQTNDNPLLLTKYVPDPNSQLTISYNMVDNSYHVKAIMLNRYGFITGLDDSTAEQLGVSVLASDIENLSLAMTYLTGIDVDSEVIIDTAESYYFDLDGNRIEGVTPVFVQGRTVSNR
ncbi:hypothetical protein [Sinobacterium caligoides]|nr:hypothetical protein [Sinobacterium caligoides]